MFHITVKSVVSLSLFAGHVCFCAYKQEPQLYSQDNFRKNIVFYCIDKNLQGIKNILLCIFKYSHETENHSQLLYSAFTVA